MTGMLVKGISPPASIKASLACLFYLSAPAFAWHELNCQVLQLSFIYCGWPTRINSLSHSTAKPATNPRTNPQLLVFLQPQEGKTLLQPSCAGAHWEQTQHVCLTPKQGAKNTQDICSDRSCSGRAKPVLFHGTRDKAVNIQSSRRKFLFTLLLFCSPKFECTGSKVQLNKQI